MISRLLFIVTVLFFSLVFCLAAYAGVLYVKPGGTGDGTSWDQAFGDPQEAIELASADEGYCQVWVAAGTYMPQGHPNGGSGGRTMHFSLRNGVTVYGGFAGDETDLPQRDYEANETIFSGDIGIIGDKNDNAYHVFYHPDGTRLNETALLDGAVISEGNADGDYPHTRGGGIYNYSSSPTLANVIISGNSASVDGGGMYNHSTSNPILTNVTITENNAAYFGGGMYNNSSSPILTNVTITGNSALRGGGMFNDSSSPTLTDMTISGNSASVDGGGMYNHSTSNPILTNVTISGNNASVDGGGMYNNSSSNPILTNVTISENSASSGGGVGNTFSSPTLANVIISGNSASVDGGGMYNGSSSSPTLTNMTISGNNASDDGGGMYNHSTSNPILTNVTITGNSALRGGGKYNRSSSDPVIKNSIFWNNGGTGSEIFNDPNYQVSTPVLSWSIVQGGYEDGEDIFTDDPLLQPLADNGGYTQTHALPVSSPAYALPESAGGGNWNDAPDTDQRGMHRALAGFRAMGAYEDPPTYTVTPSATPGGSIDPDTPQTVNHGDSAIFTVIPDTGYTASGGGTCGGILEGVVYTTDPITSDCTVEASFILNTYTVTAEAGPGGFIFPASVVVNHGEITAFTVEADTGYSISQVTGCDGSLSGNTYITGVIIGACTVNASFLLNEYSISVAANPINGGTVSGGDTYNHGDEVTVTAAANTGYTFINWTHDGQEVSMDEEYTFTALSDRDLTANFELNHYNISVNADPEDGGTVQGADTYEHGAEVLISASPNQGWGFSGWYESGLLVSSNAEYSFTADRDRTLTARFRRAGLPGVLMLLLDDEE